MAKRKTWREKLLDSKDLPKVVLLKEDAQKRWKGSTMAIPSPAEVNEIMAKVPNRKLITIEQIRKTIAHKHKTDIGCPLTCGIFHGLQHMLLKKKPRRAKKDNSLLADFENRRRIKPEIPWRNRKSKEAFRIRRPQGHSKRQEIHSRKLRKVSIKNMTMKINIIKFLVVF
jgi:hypothetical protein